ncbi:terpene synthase family protein [Streptomyces sp. UG1]|uniref:terpene synthase family protein n=1 Tax=Streptomyces sp. UG1 TaxID=3417652 RepID=UPI003CEC68AF
MTVVDTAPAPPEGFQVPALHGPVEVRMHPDADRVQESLLHWASFHGLFRDLRQRERFAQSGFARFTAYAYPRMAALETVAWWQGHNWLADDVLDDPRTDDAQAEALAADLLAQLPVDLTDRKEPVGPLATAAADLWRRTAPARSPAWRSRYRAHYRDWLALSLRTRPYRQGRIPLVSVPTYLRRRRLQSGVEMSFDLLEVGHDRELPETVAGSDLYRMVRFAANDAISWTNDLYSLHKDLAAGDTDNLAAVVRQSRGGNWTQAARKAARMVHEATADFLAACGDLRAMRGLYEVTDAQWEVVEDSLEDLALWISGSLHWHHQTPRYRLRPEAAPFGRHLAGHDEHAHRRQPS